MAKRYSCTCIDAKRPVVSHNLNPLQLILQKPQPRIYWTYKQGNTTVEFGNTPFIVGDIQHLQCQYGPQYYKSKLKKGKQLRLQSTRKIGCPAHIVVKQYILFPEYAVHSDEINGKSKHQIRLQKEHYRNCRMKWNLEVSSRPQDTGYLCQH